MKHSSVLAVFLFLSPLLLSAQEYHLNGELNGGYAHISGDGGLDGYNVGAAVWLTHKLSIAFDYDNGWDNSHLGTFELTSTGLIVSKSQLQDLYLLGPRVFFPGLIKSKKTHIARLLPFAEAQFGISNLDSKLQEPTFNISEHAADKEFSWMLGGGADYRFAPHWAARGKFDLLRTHFADTGQSRVRIGIGIVYTFKER
jgi:opacity protein-like surface antigen